MKADDDDDEGDEQSLKQASSIFIRRHLALLRRRSTSAAQQQARLAAAQLRTLQKEIFYSSYGACTVVKGEAHQSLAWATLCVFRPRPTTAGGSRTYLEPVFRKELNRIRGNVQNRIREDEEREPKEPEGSAVPVSRSVLC